MEGRLRQPERIILDTFWLTLSFPKGLPIAEVEAASRAARSRAFRRDPLRAIHRAARRHPGLAPVAVTLS